MNSPYLSYTLALEPFQLFSPSHLISLLLTVLLAFVLFICRRMLRKPSADVLARSLLAGVLALSELCFQLWHVWTNTWSIGEALPLQLCSVMLLLSMFMLLTGSYRLYEVTFFAGICGATQALLTPELFYPFPHFRFIHFFVAHAGIVLACLYMTWVRGYRPTFASVLKSMAVLNLLLLIALPVNHWTGANYLFVSRKPENPSLIDFLGPHPWYILSLEAVALVLFTLLYLPFRLRRRAAHPKRLDA
ncbi:TIGR02206 family membrane protein [Brevibacillus brevis]|uniref:TIGR02206 family membrane protein n=1 Tax=Brevibacillus brevis TaxID=1393 RepID=A0ABY9T065_BREBE|nr:TIGR02206 family membrane protein [Brevibacillus brevis]WNC12666.1 TIGR02206 family membrane protein [Brevibacillus brevis]